MSMKEQIQLSFSFTKEQIHLSVFDAEKNGEFSVSDEKFLYFGAGTIVISFAPVDFQRNYNCDFL